MRICSEMILQMAQGSIVATNLQDFTEYFLSNEFIDLFETSNFTEVISKWFVGASKSVIGIVENATNAGVDEESPEYLEQVNSQLFTNQILLYEAIWKKQSNQLKLLSKLSQAEIELISPITQTHETLCIFDWVHDYSIAIFPTVIDAEMIHLVFDLLGVSTYCRCTFEVNSGNTFDETNRMMALSPTDFNKSIVNKEKNYQRWTRVMNYYRTYKGIDLWKNRT